MALLSGLKNVAPRALLLATGLVLGLGAGFHAFEGHRFRKEGEHLAIHHLKGILRWSYFVVVTISTTGYGDLTPVTAPGRVMNTFVMFGGSGILAAATAVLAVLYTHQPPAPFQHPKDLAGVEVAVVKDSAAHQLAVRAHARLRIVDSLDTALDLVDRGVVPVAIHDELLIADQLDRNPTMARDLRHWTEHSLLDQQLTFQLPRDVPDQVLLLKLNQALLDQQADGTAQEIVERAVPDSDD
jgi:ABC-type amino acid transport substrate-binding protein